MLIRTQNKKAIINLSMIERVRMANQESENRILIMADSHTMGVYTSQERAIEVMDEICNSYVSLNKHSGKEFRGNVPSGYFGGYVKNGIYQMPEE